MMTPSSYYENLESNSGNNEGCGSSTDWNNYCHESLDCELLLHSPRHNLRVSLSWHDLIESSFSSSSAVDKSSQRHMAVPNRKSFHETNIQYHAKHTRPTKSSSSTRSSCCYNQDDESWYKWYRTVNPNYVGGMSVPEILDAAVRCAKKRDDSSVRVGGELYPRYFLDRIDESEDDIDVNALFGLHLEMYQEEEDDNDVRETAPNNDTTSVMSGQQQQSLPATFEEAEDALPNWNRLSLQQGIDDSSLGSMFGGDDDDTVPELDASSLSSFSSSIQNFNSSTTTYAEEEGNEDHGRYSSRVSMRRQSRRSSTFRMRERMPVRRSTIRTSAINQFFPPCFSTDIKSDFD